MRGMVLGFWMAWIGWGWMVYPTGKVENMDAAGGLFFVLGSLVVLYTLVFRNLIPILGARLGLSLFYIAWGWDWAFWRIAPAGNYLDLHIGALTLPMEIMLILAGIAGIVYGTYKYLINPMNKGVLQRFYPTIVATIKNLTWEQVQRVVGKLLGITLEVVFLLIGFSFISGFIDATPSPNSRFHLTVALVMITTVILMALGYFASFTEEQKGVPATSAGAYLLFLGLVFLVYPEGDLVRATLLVPAGLLLMKNAGELNAKNYLPGKGILAGIGCLIAGLFDLIYVPGDTVIAPILTPSLRGGLFMGHRILEGFALILVFIALVIGPKMNISKGTMKLMFLLPMILYGISLLAPIGTVEFAVNQPFSIFWTRGVQMTAVAGILAIVYSVSRLVPEYSKRHFVLKQPSAKGV